MNDLQEFHRRNLPHYYPKYKKFFITFRLYNTIPYQKLLEWQTEYNEEIQKITDLINTPEYDIKLDIANKKYFFKQDDYLDSYTEKLYLSIPEIAEIVKNAILYYENTLYETLAYCIMPNHVHWVLDTSIQQKNSEENYKNLSSFMKSIKGYSANICNKILNKKGYFWQKESYDRVIRNEKEEQNIINYVYNNPVKANLVTNPEDWRYNYIRL